jgi:5'-nucleotidase
VNRVPIGFIGVVATETPSIVIPSGVADVDFLDEAETVNHYVAELRVQGAKTIIVLIHEGGEAETPTSPVTGPIVDFANAVSDDVDVIVSGHTHQGYITQIDGKLVTQAWYYMRGQADIDLVINRITGEVVGRSAELIQTWDDAIAPDPHIAAMVAEYEALVAPLINRQISVAAVPITRDDTTGTGETALGNPITDAQRWKTGAAFALTNPGGIREDISAEPVTWGDLFTVQPFGNNLVMLDLTGAQLYALLEQQWQEGGTRFLQISGFEYDYDPSRAAGSRIVDVRDGSGTPLDPQTSYRVVANAFLAGGDSFTIMAESTNREIGPNELDALVEFIQTQLPEPFSAAIEGRIRIVQ